MGGRGASSGNSIKVGKIYKTIYNGKQTEMIITNIEKNGSISGKIKIDGLPEVFRNMSRETFNKRFKK